MKDERAGQKGRCCYRALAKPTVSSEAAIAFKVFDNGGEGPSFGGPCPLSTNHEYWLPWERERHHLSEPASFQ